MTRPETVSAGHVQVQQDQIPVGFFGQAGFQLGNARHFDQTDIRAKAQSQLDAVRYETEGGHRQSGFRMWPFFK
jgi:hypothetical protein